MNNAYSYIIPLYNSKGTILRSLESALQQENALEIILVDDGSTDGVQDALSPYLQEHKNVRYIRNPTQLGPGLSRNAGARIARGDVLVFLDADIVIPPETGKKIKKYFEENEIQPPPDMIVANRAKQALERGWVSRYKNFWTSYNLSKLKGWTSFVGSSCIAVKKNAFDAVQGFRAMPSAEDSDLGYRLVMSGRKIYFADDISVSHSKKFSALSLFKREFIAGKEGIKVAIRNKVLGELAREKKFFAVGSNFIYSFPFSFLFSLSVATGLFLWNPVYLLLAAVSFSIMIFLNRDFLVYAADGRPRFTRIWDLFLMIPQMHAIGLGMLAGWFELWFKKISKTFTSLFMNLRSAYKLFIKEALGPEQITFFVTNRCDLCCGHCFVAKNSAMERPELTLEEYEKVTQNMPPIRYVTVTGGEPFLREDIVSIVTVLSRNLQPALVTLLTNGYSPAKVGDGVKKILESNPRMNLSVKISIDGPPEIHDEMRQQKGAFDAARETFLKLKQLKEHHKKLTVGLLTTCTEKNWTWTERLYDGIIRELEPDQYGVVLERPAKANKLNQKIDIAQYCKTVERIYRNEYAHTKTFFESFRLAYKLKMLGKLEAIYRQKTYPMKCFAGKLNAIIASDGNVFACEQRHESFGSLREAHYRWNRVWGSSRARDVRNSIKQKECFCTNECFMPFNISYNVQTLCDVLMSFAGMHWNLRRKHLA